MYVKKIIIMAVCICLVVVNSPVFSSPAVIRVGLKPETQFPTNLAIGGTSLVLTFANQWETIDTLNEEKEFFVDPPPLLRFPAGTHAMFYDWQTGFYDAPRFKGKRKLSNHSTDDFFQLASLYGADVIYIVNVFQDTPKKTEMFAHYLKEKGYEVRYWELGNEAYAPHWKSKIESVSNYLVIAQAHAQSIRKVFPDAEFGVTASHKSRFRNSWNQALANQNIFKNIIIHDYHGPNKKKRKSLFKRGGQIGADAAYKKMLKASEPVSVRWRDIFPEKRFWVTEWGSLYLGMDVQNSMAHAIWMARTFIKYIRIPEIDLACYWNMNTRPFGLLNTVDGVLVHRVPFYVYQMVSNQLRWAKKSLELDFNSEGKIVRNVEGQMFLGDGGRKSLFIVNGEGRKLILDLSIINEAIDNVIELKSSNIKATNGYSLAQNPLLRSQTKENVVPSNHQLKENLVTIGAYSVAVIKFKTKKNLL